MIGVEPLRLGTGSFHAMFSVVDHLIGRPFSPLTPLASGPRHAGQLSADNVTTNARQPIDTNAGNRFDTTRSSKASIVDQVGGVFHFSSQLSAVSCQLVGLFLPLD